MFYIFFAFLFSFMLYASEDMEDTPSFFYFDDAELIRKLTKRNFLAYYENHKPDHKLIFSTREHGNDLEWQEIAGANIILLDIEMPGTQGNEVAKIIRDLAEENDALCPCIIAVTSLEFYWERNNAKSQGFYAGFPKIKTHMLINDVLEIYNEWKKEQKEKTYVFSFEDSIREETNGLTTAQGFGVAVDDHNNQSIDLTSRKITNADPRKIFPYEADLSSEQNDEDDTKSSCFRGCLERITELITGRYQLRGLY